MENRITYHFNYVTRGLTFLIGIFCFIFTFFVIQANVIEEIYGKPDISDFVILFIICSLFTGFGLACLIVPRFAKLTIHKHGYEYQTMSFTLTALWTESYIASHMAHVFGKSGLLVPLAAKLQLNKSAHYLGIKDFSGGVPVNFFGKFTSRNIKQEIQKNAPYLLGFLLTEEEFLTTISAFDQLILCYKNKETSPYLFFMQYNSFYKRYIIQGSETVNDYFHLITKHSKRIAYHTAVWNEIISSQTPDHEMNYQQNIVHLEKIMKRYE